MQVRRERFGLQRVALVGDRGMIAQTRIDADLQPAGFDWITALRGDTLRKLVKRNVLLELTAADAEQLAAGYAAGRYDRDEFNRRLGGLRRRRLGKHFEWTFDAQTEAFNSRRKQESIRAEERLDGI